MPIAVDTSTPTGRSFIDSSHPIIAAYVNTICDELLSDKKIPQILHLMEQLIQQVSSYIDSKSSCQDKSDCPAKHLPLEALERLQDLNHVLTKYAETMPENTAVFKLRRWAKEHIFDSDQKCACCTDDC
ncbi:hypothetical protein MTBPR1_10452 [Candidatus Terasakiella magnetica]|uniref:Uncharacterized protein n=1 Tax=Candidatus Terasakiella magnetica TaxID=1867952 RepID=A0A1C3RD72_9PROT|nr:hypothetical protein [Candidatus Terasakiella magnetica]SCA55205.1 hypothetical protein MTBPR1_10452 [Candidatus Terasakiella magnetica]